MCKAVVRCFAECGIAPRVARHPSFYDLIRTVQAHPGAKLPDHQSLLRKNGNTGSYLAAVLADAVAWRDVACMDAKNVAHSAQKLLTCYSPLGGVERCHKLNSRHRNEYCNRKYCEIARAESKKRRRENHHSREHDVMEAFQSRMRSVVRARKEQEAARAIDEARAEIGGVAGDSDDKTAPPNGFDDILNEVCEEAGYESDESDEGAW